MKNEVAWHQPDNKDFPMILDERGLNFAGRTAFFFYFSGIAATLSMVWVSILSARLLYIAYNDNSITKQYIMVAVTCLVISAVSFYSFIKIYSARKKYRRQIEITEKEVFFKETTHKGITIWREKIKKFDGITLKHYIYKKVESWYVVFEHQDSTKNVVLFAPNYDSRQIPENDKKALLAKYGTKFSLLTTYSRMEEEVNNVQAKS